MPLGKFGTTVALVFAIGVTGCNKRSDTPANTAQTQEQQDPNYDPASANMAPVDQAATSGPVNESATAPAPSSALTRPQPTQSAPSTADAGNDVPPPPPDESYPADNTVPASEVNSDQSGYYDTAAAEQPVYAPQPPPSLPVYEQPPCPGPNYLWTPGYWGYQPTGYFWIPGAWVIAPYIGALWTPGYWGWSSNRYIWNHGYWGPHIGYYGGINYGHGYVGSGYYGGYWNQNNFYYNRSVTNVNAAVVRNVYVRNVTINNVNINNYNNNRISYNGGRGGIMTRPTNAELQASRERHMPPLTAQTLHAREASQNRAQFFSINHGQPQTVAANRPLTTSFHEPAAHPPVRGVANPGFAERINANRTANQPQVQQHSEARPGTINTSRPQSPNLIRPQAHPENTVSPMRPGESHRMQPQPQQSRTTEQPRPVMQHQQPSGAQPQREPQQVHPESRPAPHVVQQQPGPVVQHQQPPRAPQEFHQAAPQRPEPQQRPQPEQQRPVVQHQQPQRAPQEFHQAPHQEPQQRPESRPQEQPRGDHGHR